MVDIMNPIDFDHIMNTIRRKPVKLSLCPSLQHTPFGEGDEIPIPENGILNCVILCAQQCGNNTGFRISYKTLNGKIDNFSITIRTIPDLDFSSAKFVKDLDPAFQRAIINYLLKLFNR